MDKKIQKEVKELKKYTDIDIFRNDPWGSWRETDDKLFCALGELTEVGDYPQRRAVGIAV